MVTVRGHAERLGEGACKMIEAKIGEFREDRQRNVLGKMFLDEFGEALLSPRRQAATDRPCGTVFCSFESEELMDKHDAQGLGILTAARICIADLSLEFERGVPNRLIEEEQARPNRRGSRRVRIN